MLAYCLLSRSVGFAFCYHREYFSIWTVLVGCFVTFSGLERSTYKPREDRFQSTLPLTYIRRTMERRRILVSTYGIQPKHGLCADIICGDSGSISKNDVSSLVSDISSFHLCCRNF